MGPDLAREMLLGPEGPTAGYLQRHILLLPSKLPRPPGIAYPSPRNTPSRTIGSDNLIFTLYDSRVWIAALMTCTVKPRVEAWRRQCTGYTLRIGSLFEHDSGIMPLCTTGLPKIDQI